MDNLKSQIKSTKEKYREIFVKSIDLLQERIDEIKPKDVIGEIFDKYSENSIGHQWQQKVLEMFENDISKDIVHKWGETLKYQRNFSCACCGTCCKLACSEFSPKELKQKAKNGDRFATQFLSVFIPYENREDAEKIYPEYLQMLKDEISDDVYFYHCPKVDKNNRCTDYENRPQICRDFPDNPLSLLPPACGFKAWKDEVEPINLMLHSMVEIIEFYKNKIDEQVK